MERKKLTLQERFESHIEVKLVPESGMRSPCSLWTGTVNNHGYAMFSDEDGRTRLASHVAMRLAGTPIQRQANHLCNIRCCVAVGHIYDGTQSQNQTQMYMQKRRKAPAHNPRKLSPEDVATIRSDYAAGRASQYELARRFNVIQGHISQVVNFKAHAGVTDRNLGPTANICPTCGLVMAWSLSSVPIVWQGECPRCIERAMPETSSQFAIN